MLPAPSSQPDHDVPPVQSGLLTEHIARRLEHDIRSGQLSVGAKLPSERDLAKQFHSSLNVVREVLYRREAQHLIEVAPGRGSYVREHTSAHARSYDALYRAERPTSPSACAPTAPTSTSAWTRWPGSTSRRCWARTRPGFHQSWTVPSASRLTGRYAGSYGCAAASSSSSSTGDAAYETFAVQQRNWVLGANAWGSSFVIGAGSVSPCCPGHQVSNLSGKELTGAAVNGPNKADKFAELKGFPTMKRCAVPGFARFDGRGARYVDDVGTWQSVEPALDFTATAPLYFALASS